MFTYQSTRNAEFGLSGGLFYVPFIRIEIAETSEKAQKFHKRVTAGAPFPAEKEQVLDEAWNQGRTPTETVHYRGIGNGQTPTLKFDVEVNLDLNS